MFSLKRGKGAVCCPHCGERVPASDRCEACGMLLQRWRRKDVIRFLLFAGFICFLFVFQIVHSRREPKRVHIREINPLLNFWTVRVDGTLKSDARLMKSGSLFYVIDDGSGTLAVFDLNVGKDLKAGDRVSVVGSLQVGAGNNRRLQAKQVDVFPDESGGGLADIHSGMIGEQVSVTGIVVRVWAPKSGSRAPHKIILEDADAELDVVHWLSGVPEITIGDEVCVSGKVGEYKGELQLKVVRASDLKVLKSNF